MKRRPFRLQVEELEPRTLLSGQGLIGGLEGFVSSLIHPVGISPTVAQAHADTLTGIEISPGFIHNGTRYGAAFVGQATGDLPGGWAVSVNYTPPHPGPSVTNTIVGGTWSVAVVTQGHFRGLVFGKVLSGTVVWNADGTQATITATLSVQGGTGAFRGVTGSGTFTGTLSHTTFPPQISGSLNVTF